MKLIKFLRTRVFTLNAATLGFRKIKYLITNLEEALEHKFLLESRDKKRAFRIILKNWAKIILGKNSIYNVIDRSNPNRFKARIVDIKILNIAFPLVFYVIL